MAETKTGPDVVMVNVNGTLGMVRRGALVGEMAEALQALVRKVRETGRKGKMVVKVMVMPEDGEGKMVTLDGEVRLDLPQPKREPTWAYTTRDGRLQRDDPQQEEMDFEKGK
jgi:hypothetical protein